MGVQTTAVEYYSESIDRYFLTARIAEQKALDALPQQFRKTGASFLTTRATFRADQQQPVCRFYSPVPRGGSNSHFYGTGNDCALLNTINAVAYEGYDFAAVSPVNGACPSGTPAPITRMFNNKGATKNGNHRYVNNAVDKSQMLARGWVDEGVAFCALAAVPASSAQ